MSDTDLIREALDLAAEAYSGVAWRGRYADASAALARVEADMAAMREALANVRAECVSEAFLDSSQRDVILMEIDAALAAVSDGETGTHRASTHSHAARVTGEGDE